MHNINTAAQSPDGKSSSKLFFDGIKQFYGEEKDGVVTFHSIPYAEPPTGDLRWKAPVLIKSKF